MATTEPLELIETRLLDELLDAIKTAVFAASIEPAFRGDKAWNELVALARADIASVEHARSERRRAAAELAALIQPAQGRG
jgi:hypothetical protein